ncbi:hypothetical protein GGR57DRAFT_462580 [Xylariaceae sp. FL1272]|nr:hypothetical protein GGR57DRAFT_462580 [Xylariaceae sp. FL1272]
MQSSIRIYDPFIKLSFYFTSAPFAERILSRISSSYPNRDNIQVLSMETSINIELPDAFKKSYGNYIFYPNLVNDAFVEEHGELELRRLTERLEARAERLLVPEDKTDVVAWDISVHGEVKRSLCNSNADLYSFLGDQYHANPQHKVMIQGQLATLADPKFRLISLRCDSVTTSIKISLEGLQRLFTCHGVSPNILEFLDVYGLMHRSGFCGFRYVNHLEEDIQRFVRSLWCLPIRLANHHGLVATTEAPKNPRRDGRL